MTEWRTIDTAPKTGEWFLAFRPPPAFGSWDTIVPIAFCHRADDFIWPDKHNNNDPYGLPIDGKEPWVENEDFYEARGTFTHWMPLPDPPRVDSEATTRE